MSRGEQTWGRRCDTGCESWPDRPEFATCPICEEPAPRWSNLFPLSEEEAAEIVNGILFERYYDESHTPDLTLTPDEQALADAADARVRHERSRA